MTEYSFYVFKLPRKTRIQKAKDYYDKLIEINPVEVKTVLEVLNDEEVIEKEMNDCSIPEFKLSSLCNKDDEEILFKYNFYDQKDSNLAISVKNLNKFCEKLEVFFQMSDQNNLLSKSYKNKYLDVMRYISTKIEYKEFNINFKGNINGESYCKELIFFIPAEQLNVESENFLISTLIKNDFTSNVLLLSGICLDYVQPLLLLRKCFEVLHFRATKNFKYDIPTDVFNEDHIESKYQKLSMFEKQNVLDELYNNDSNVIFFPTSNNNGVLLDVKPLNFITNMSFIANYLGSDILQNLSRIAFPHYVKKCGATEEDVKMFYDIDYVNQKVIHEEN